jgi:hypothetical protein
MKVAAILGGEIFSMSDGQRRASPRTRRDGAATTGYNTTYEDSILRGKATRLRHDRDR